MASEKNFENKIKKYLKEKNCWFIKYWAGAEFTKSGIPDLLVCYKGIFIAIEVKGEKGKPSELQLHNIKKINEAGGIGIVLYPYQFELFKRMMDYIEDWELGGAQEIAEKINKGK